VLQKKYDLPMPAFLKFETDTIEKMEVFRFDDPWDERRFFASGDNQIAGVATASRATRRVGRDCQEPSRRHPCLR
jgi:hypothetical protein